ncbi:MAG: hypothetical protein AAGD96_18130 [Chloroflexota bacterium]
MLQVFEITQRGLTNRDSLSQVEWLIFVVDYLESVSTFQGWDHFFSYNMDWYPKVLELLESADDKASLAVLHNYEEHFKKLGVDFTSEAIDNFLTNPPVGYLESCSDWRDEFVNLHNQRWKLITEYFKSKGVEIEAEYYDD